MLLFVHFTGCTILNWATDGLRNAVSKGGDNCIGSTYTFQCNDGYTAFTGNTVRTCQCNNAWSGSPLQCAGKNNKKHCGIV